MPFSMTWKPARQKLGFEWQTGIMKCHSHRHPPPHSCCPSRPHSARAGVERNVRPSAVAISANVRTIRFRFMAPSATGGGLSVGDDLRGSAGAKLEGAVSRNRDVERTVRVDVELPGPLTKTEMRAPARMSAGRWPLVVEAKDTDCRNGNP